MTVLIFDARGNGDGGVSPTITGDHQNRITDYTAIVVELNGETVLQPDTALLADGSRHLDADN